MMQADFIVEYWQVFFFLIFRKTIDSTVVSIIFVRFVLCFSYLNEARKRFIESKLQSLDKQTPSIDFYIKVLESAKEKRDVQKRFVPIMKF